MIKVKDVLIFGVGFGAGFLSSYFFLKKRYEMIAQEEIDSVKKTYTKRNFNLKDIADAAVREGIDVDIRLDPKSSNLKEYDDTLKESGYLGKSINEEKDMSDKPYVIFPEEFGEFDDYEKISLTYYADRVLADENDEEIDNVEECVGMESLNHFGDYEDDSVFVRNDRLKCDYEILLDQRNYADLRKKIPH